MELKKGLIIKREHCENILNGLKTHEMRPARTNFKGEFGLIIAGTKKVFGKATLIGCAEYKIHTRAVWHAFYEQHRCKEYMPQWPWAWELEDVVKFDEPIDYNHKNGCVTWVNL